MQIKNLFSYNMINTGTRKKQISELFLDAFKSIVMRGKMDRVAKWTDFGFLTLKVNNKKSISSIQNLMVALSSARQNTSESHLLGTVRPRVVASRYPKIPGSWVFF